MMFNIFVICKFPTVKNASSLAHPHTSTFKIVKMFITSLTRLVAPESYSIFTKYISNCRIYQTLE